MYNNFYNPQASVDRINTQIAELEKMKSQIPQQIPQPITQNFQIAPTNSVIRYANNIEEVQKDFVIGDTPYFSKDMSILWIKNTKGEIKSYEIIEIIQKDEKDIQIEILQTQIEELKKVINNESNEHVDDAVENKKSTTSKSNTKSDK